MCRACVLSHSVVSDTWDPVDCRPPGSSVHGDSPDKNAGCVAMPSSRRFFPTQGLNPGLPPCRWILYHLSHQGSQQGRPSHSVVSDSLQLHELHSPWDSPGQNTGVGSCSLLQGIFPTQELNQGLLHGRQILYPLSYQGSPLTTTTSS